ncbi:hypothetical protein GE107_13440 [Cohnella sp. CFH 77786]|uniref:hypothetical protein n=1 Tax=Cohnella sp. CFH 77786 TaxID=2662265 RepID=UPI001C60E0F3|nr:hypothetical protein [Cohnella sp. CFH 77786]MBW5447067.1 hypothetical protein [Cohnella sp. CFH 77786]
MKTFSMIRTLILSLVLLFTATSTIYAQEAQPQPQGQSQANPQVKDTKNKECLCEVLKKLKELSAYIEELKKIVTEQQKLNMDQQKKIEDLQKQIDALGGGQSGGVNLYLEGYRSTVNKLNDGFNKSVSLFSGTLESEGKYKLDITMNVTGSQADTFDLSLLTGAGPNSYNSGITMSRPSISTQTSTVTATWIIDSFPTNGPTYFKIAAYTGDNKAYATNISYNIIHFDE